MVQADSFEYLQISEETFRTIFNTPELTFKDGWLTIEDMSAYDYSLYKEKLDKDSLSSHPETKERLDYLTRVFPDITESDRLEADKEYTRYNEMSVMEIVPSLYQQKAYGSALHVALMLYESGENKDYHKAWIGFCLDKLANARKTLTFNNYINQVNPKEHSMAVQQFLSFMWNLKSVDLTHFATYYMNEYPLKI